MPSLNLDQFTSPDYWLARAPGLHIGNGNVTAAPFAADAARLDDLRARLMDEGYFQAHNDWGVDLEVMVSTVRRFAADNVSPVFCFLYDEFWAPFHALAPVYRGLLGDYRMLPDFWIWNVDPAKGEAGWKPHRDKGRMALFPDGSPKSLTTWIALSKATPLNSCMYLVPANQDPVYGTAQENEMRFEHAAARALPAEPGDFFMWNQAVMHWGSRTSFRAEESRVSMAFEFQRSDVPPFNQPLLKPGVPLSFRDRLTLVAKQVLQYRHMYRVDPGIEAVALNLVGAVA
jgi:hypothetical protein